MYMHTYIHICKYAYICTYIFKYIHIYSHTYNICTYAHTLSLSHLHPYTNKLTNCCARKKERSNSLTQKEQSRERVPVSETHARRAFHRYSHTLIHTLIHTHKHSNAPLHTQTEEVSLPLALFFFLSFTSLCLCLSLSLTLSLTHTSEA